MNHNFRFFVYEFHVPILHMLIIVFVGYKSHDFDFLWNELPLLIIPLHCQIKFVCKIVLFFFSFVYELSFIIAYSM